MKYGQLRWSVALDDGDFFVYEAATQDFIEFLRLNGVDVSEDMEITGPIRRRVFVFQKGLRVKLRELYPDARSISTSFGEARRQVNSTVVVNDGTVVGEFTMIKEGR